MNKVVWKASAPPKIKFFAWLAIQNRLWTADRLEKRGLTNCGLCPLCKQAQETAAHLFFQCRYSKRIWGMVKNWLGLHYLSFSDWTPGHGLGDWWISMSDSRTPNRKAMESITMLVRVGPFGMNEMRGSLGIDPRRRPSFSALSRRTQGFGSPRA